MRDGIDRSEISVFLMTTWKNGRPAFGPHLFVAVELLLLFPPLDKFTIHRLNRLFLQLVCWILLDHIPHNHS